MRALVIALLGLSGCPVPQPRPAPPVAVDFGGLPDCPAGTPAPVTEDVCGTAETFDHLRCVRCAIDQACVYRQAMVYCAITCFDPACSGGQGGELGVPR